jgi:hypothetical protein
MRALHRIGIGVLLLPAAAAIAAATPATAATTSSTAAVPRAAAVAEQAAPLSAGDGTIAGAIAWMQNHAGNTGYEGYCEKAVENAYGTTGVWASAIAHWNAGVHHTGSTAPKGAFVYWNTSVYGHVGIADGNGGFYSSSINGAIGHATSVSHFQNYLGWTNAQVPHN